MTEYAWPSGITIGGASFRLVDGSRSFKSALSGTVRTQKVHPPTWEGSVKFVNLPVDEGQAIEAYLWRIQGAVNRALVPMADYQRQGAGGGTPVVSGTGQTGLSLTTSGWPNSTLVLKAGDRISVDGQAFSIVADATSNGSGVATLTLANDIRTSPSNGASIETDTPIVRCILKSVFSLDTEPGHFKNGIAEFEEAVP